MTQKYDKEFKVHAVQLALESGKPASQVARELGVSQKTLYGWMAKYKEDPATPFVGSGNLKPEAKVLRDLGACPSNLSGFSQKGIFGSPAKSHVVRFTTEASNLGKEIS